MASEWIGLVGVGVGPVATGFPAFLTHRRETAAAKEAREARLAEAQRSEQVDRVALPREITRASSVLLMWQHDEDEIGPDEVADLAEVLQRGVYELPPDEADVCLKWWHGLRDTSTQDRMTIRDQCAEWVPKLLEAANPRTRSHHSPRSCHPTGSPDLRRGSGHRPGIRVNRPSSRARIGLEPGREVEP